MALSLLSPHSCFYHLLAQPLLPPNQSTLTTTTWYLPTHIIHGSIPGYNLTSAFTSYHDSMTRCRQTTACTFHSQIFDYCQSNLHSPAMFLSSPTIRTLPVHTVHDLPILVEHLPSQNNHASATYYNKSTACTSYLFLSPDIVKCLPKYPSMAL